MLLQAGVINPDNQTLTIELEFLPLWLAKINITSKIQEENPELANRIFMFQLKAKDVLAKAFIDNSYFTDLDSISGIEREIEIIKKHLIALEKIKELETANIFLTDSLKNKELILEKYELVFDEGLMLVTQFAQQLGVGEIKFGDILRHLDISYDSTKQINQKYSKYFKYVLTYCIDGKLRPIVKVNSDGIVLLDDLINNGFFTITNPRSNSPFDAKGLDSLSRKEICAVIMANKSLFDSILNKY